MSIEKVWRVECDRCCVGWTMGDLDFWRNEDQAADSALAAGWTIHPATLCKDCTGSIEQKMHEGKEPV